MVTCACLLPQFGRQGRCGVFPLIPRKTIKEAQGAPPTRKNLNRAQATQKSVLATKVSTRGTDLQACAAITSLSNRSNSWETKLKKISNSNRSTLERWTSPRKTRRTKADRARTSRILSRRTLRRVTIPVSAMVKKVPSRLKSVAHRSLVAVGGQSPQRTCWGIFLPPRVGPDSG